MGEFIGRADVIKIGMRNIKTTLSVFICLLVFEAINRGNVLFACIAAIICVQNTIVDSVRIGMSRIIGTMIGGLSAALMLFIVNTFFDDKILIFIIPLGIMILIQICVTINMKQAVAICCVVYLIVMISMNHEEGYILYTINRVLDTSIGIIIALLVNKYMKIPEKFKTKFKDELTEAEEVEIINEEEKYN
jgi:uncharacterized membrane protein YgaE (UPF0421/DUF939 family)